MIPLYLLSILIFCVGGYHVTCELLELPSGKTRRTMQSAAQQNGIQHDGEVDRFVTDLAEKLHWLIRIDPVRRTSLENVLKIAKKNTSPEAFILSIVLLALLVFAAFIPVAIVMGDIAMLGLGALLGVALAVMQYRRVTASVGDRRDRIVAECPRFANYLTQNLATQNRDLLGMLSAYQRTATCPDFAEEIAQTVADMKTGNYERALFNLQHRVDHPSMTEIVRGLQGVLHGDDQTMYFERVCFDMKNLEQALLRKEAAKRPRKITKYQFAIMAGTILMMAVALVTQLLDSLQVLFQ